MTEAFRDEFLKGLVDKTQCASVPRLRVCTNELPIYDLNDASVRNLLVTRSKPETFQLGTGASIFTSTLIPAIISAQFEVILVTCFWAPSATLTALCDALKALAEHRRAFINDAVTRGKPAPPSLTIRICFSSRSFFQKLLHPQSRRGYVYPPSSWSSKLGLPEPALLEAGRIKLQVKSLFFLPFSVMHPKYIIVDRKRAFIPSCNISWEPWLEGCVEITGDALKGLLSFFVLTWGDTLEFSYDPGSEGVENQLPDIGQSSSILVRSTAHWKAVLRNLSATILTFVLPSPHHRNPRFRPLPWQSYPAPPATPLNAALLQLFESARESIYVQTPNLTSQPVVIALLEALERGVDVTVVTNRHMMIFEQLLTAGTITAWSLRSLIRRYGQIKARYSDSVEVGELEARLSCPGRLRVAYFHSRSHPVDSVYHDESGAHAVSSSADSEEPVHSHLKLMIVDDEYVMLGSGNMDRASWYTSQELGVMFHSRELAEQIRGGLDDVLEGRLSVVFDSDN
ncbi:uncharacterized protein CTHT_0050740 [Thermochaetoides thermophila DSM 1495]|uniref:PLD phosphodiesterase domain-containing protein n=1 Tax=Chaetomium thermophilum (strain DSM 1495 / CBS 144.50 / IMI 039719) TaxID=759272 RepID=G0SD42_CHATD|nr:hypothetical protein CTHT_0050740 [Thermochaetoides thermophila DSM 1495]EGS18472.1 hypothetical protein CTHT_0050740 [Thermochaetoides thermophila DSM 1495]